MGKKIMRIADFAKEKLKCGKTGYVHSVYRKTINLYLDGQLIALQAKEAPMSPISIIIDACEEEFGAFKIQAGDKVFVTASNILISEVRFHDENAEIVELKLINRIMKVPGENLLEFSMIYAGIMELLKEKQVLEFFFVNGRAYIKTQISLYAEKVIDNFLIFIDKGEYENASQSIMELVGLGKGLTPSGDDFLCGMAAGLAFDKENRKAARLLELLQKSILDAVKRTNDISGAFLKCAVYGYFSEAVIQLPFYHDGKSIAGLFSKIGHSSGGDTLCGIYFALSIFQNFV